MRAFSRKVCWTAAALLFISGTGAAETRGGSADQPIDEIVVVAHKAERRLRDVAANVTVLDRDDIEQNLAMSVGDVSFIHPACSWPRPLQAAWRGADGSWQGTGVAAAAGARAGVLLGGSLHDGGAGTSAIAML